MIRESSERQSPFPPVVFKHVAVVSWGAQSLRMEQRGSTVVVDVLSGPRGASRVLLRFETLLHQLSLHFFHGHDLWRLELRGDGWEEAEQEEEKGGVATMSPASVNWVFAKLGTALCSAYMGDEAWLLVELFREYWRPALEAWLDSADLTTGKAQLVLWARPGAMQTVDRLATRRRHLFAGQNFDALTDLLCGQLFQSTADGGTWFFPTQKWQQETEDGLAGGKRGLWACYSAALVITAGDVFYSRDSSDTCLTAILCVYGTSGPELWEDYRDTKQNSILLREECFAARGLKEWRALEITVLYLVLPEQHLEQGRVLILELSQGGEVDPKWERESPVRGIMADLARHWQSSPMSRKVRIVACPNHPGNVANHAVCLKHARLSAANPVQWYLHEPPPGLCWQPVVLPGFESSDTEPHTVEAEDEKPEHAGAMLEAFLKQVCRVSVRRWAGAWVWWVAAMLALALVAWEKGRSLPY